MFVLSALVSYHPLEGSFNLFTPSLLFKHLVESLIGSSLKEQSWSHL